MYAEHKAPFARYVRSIHSSPTATSSLNPQASSFAMSVTIVLKKPGTREPFDSLIDSSGCTCFVLSPNDAFEVWVNVASPDQMLFRCAVDGYDLGHFITVSRGYFDVYCDKNVTPSKSYELRCTQERFSWTANLADVHVSDNAGVIAVCARQVLAGDPEDDDGDREPGEDGSEGDDSAHDDGVRQPEGDDGDRSPGRNTVDEQDELEAKWNQLSAFSQTKKIEGESLHERSSVWGPAVKFSNTPGLKVVLAVERDREYIEAPPVGRILSITTARYDTAERWYARNLLTKDHPLYQRLFPQQDEGALSPRVSLTEKVLQNWADIKAVLFGQKRPVRVENAEEELVCDLTEEQPCWSKRLKRSD